MAQMPPRPDGGPPSPPDGGPHRLTEEQAALFAVFLSEFIGHIADPALRVSLEEARANFVRSRTG